MSKPTRSIEKRPSVFSNSPFIVPAIEGLEDRRMLSVAHHSIHSNHRGGGHHGGGHEGGAVSEIAFSLAPAAVQSGLISLASADGVIAPTSSTEVRLGNKDGVETYSIKETSTGTSSTLTVDSTGAAVTAATRTTTTYGAITNTAVTSEISAIATALNLTAPASTTSVTQTTASNGTITYSIGLTSTTTSTTTGSTIGSGRTRTTHISVDSNGNPVGNERVPLSVLSTAIQNGLTTHAPAGATPLTSTSLINVTTHDGVTLYSTTYKATGIRSTVSVNSTGALASGTTKETVEFSTLPPAAQTELQTLATAEGVTTAIDSTQDVTETTEANGTVLYSVKLTATSATDPTDTYSISLTVDSAGNPTVAPGIFSPFAGAFGGFFGGGFR